MENVKFGLLKKVSSHSEIEAVEPFTQTEGGEFRGHAVLDSVCVWENQYLGSALFSYNMHDT